MKILQVIHYFPPASLGGGELYTYQLAKKLIEEHDVRLFFTAPQSTAARESETGFYEGIPFWRLKKNFCNFGQPFHERSRWVEKEFIKALDAFEPDIIHFQHLINLSLNLPAIAKKCGIPCCFTLHDFWLLCPRHFFLNQKLQLCPAYDARRCTDCLSDRTGYYNTSSRGALPIRLFKESAKKSLNYAKNRLLAYSLTAWRPVFTKKIFQNIDQFIVPSRFLLEKYIQSGVPESKILFCPHGFDAQDLQNTTKTPSEAVRFAYIGAIRPHKGISVLIEAFNRIHAPHELKIYGILRAGLREELQKKIKNPRIRIMGELKAEDKPKAFSEIDVLLVPSICFESYSLIISEAFISKTPVIVSAIGAMAERIKDGVNGLTFSPGDSEALAQKIIRLISEGGLKDRLSAQAPAVKTMSVHAEEILQIYNAILDAHQTARPRPHGVQ